MDKKEIVERVAADGVSFISFQFTDVIGSVKSLDMPVSRLEDAIDRGIWFDGSSVEGFARIQESDMRLIPDLETYAVLPWSPQGMLRARFFCDIYNPDGSPFAGDPRGNLRRQLAELEARGMRYMVGSEPEFFLFRRNGNSDIHPVPHDVGGYFDFSPNDEAVRVRTELMQALDSMGLEVEVGHHECALGQHEIDFRYSNALRSADNVLTLKYTVKAIAAKNGLVTSFMPKPIFGIAGSGMHCHQSLFDLQGNNLFYDSTDKLFLSPLAKGFIAGQLAHARAFSAVTAPTVNSYKRLVPGFEAPVYVVWAQTNRSALIRIPQPMEGMSTAVRAELRCPDPSCNPYLAYSAMLASALDGVERKLPAPEPMNDINVYELSRKERKALGIQELPASLREALMDLENDTVIKRALGDSIYESFLRAKWVEWDRFRIDVTDWELVNYLETA